MRLLDKDGSTLSVVLSHSYPTYGGWMEGRPTEKDNPRTVEKAIASARKRSYLEPVIYLHNVNLEEVLPHWVHNVWFYNLSEEKQILVVWFDDYEIDPILKLTEILKTFDWAEHSSEWSF